MIHVRPGLLPRSTAAALSQAAARVGGLSDSGLSGGATRVGGVDSQWLNLPNDPPPSPDSWFAELTDAGVGSPPAHSWHQVVQTAPGVWAAGERSGAGNAYRATAAGGSSRAGRAGDVVVMRPSDTLPGMFEFLAADQARRPLGPACLVVDGYGNAVGIAQVWVEPDGSAKCEVRGACEGCDETALPPPPPPPPVPPPPPAEENVVYVRVQNCDGTPVVGRQVSVTGASDSPQTTGSSGELYFHDGDWVSNALSVTLAGSGEFVVSNTTSLCSSYFASQSGYVATAGAGLCGGIAVIFTIGPCSEPDPP